MHLKSATNTLRKNPLRTMIIAVSAVGTLMATAGTAAAACGRIEQMPLAQAQLGVVGQAPVFRAAPSQKEKDNREVPAQQAKDQSRTGIVGLWHVNYTDSQGNPFYEAFDLWHADGTEWETAYSYPRAGNYCLGVYEQVGPRTVHLSHVGWTFNPDGSAAGYFTMSDTDTVNGGGDSYEGTFDYKLYDVNGNLVTEVTGTQVATRFHL